MQNFTYRPNVLVGVRMRLIFSNKSSLKERALLANFVPFRLFLWPELPGAPGVEGVCGVPNGVPGCWVGVAGDGVLGEGVPIRLDCEDSEELGVEGELMALSEIKKN